VKAKTRKTRLLRRVAKQQNGCWLWTGARSANGQGNMQIAHKQHATHRLAYQLWLGPIPLYLTSLEERLLRKIKKQENGCWIWRGHINAKGYGRIELSKRKYTVHRVAYELWIEPIPEGLVILHLCSNSLCCNPAHLVAGTAQENAKHMRRKSTLRRPGTQRVREKPR
jgi:hypothetical protein